MTSPEQLSDATAFLFGVSRADLFGRSRVARVVEARQALAWALRRNEWTLEAIGMYLRRDHTTIIYALAQMERKSRRNTRLAERLAALDVPASETAFDWRARIAALEMRVAELEAKLHERRDGTREGI